MGRPLPIILVSEYWGKRSFVWYKNLARFFFVLSQFYTRLTDEQTDRFIVAIRACIDAAPRVKYYRELWPVDARICNAFLY